MTPEDPVNAKVDSERHLLIPVALREALQTKPEGHSPGVDPIAERRGAVAASAPTLVSLAPVDNYRAAALGRPPCRFGLSFASRICLALARCLGMPALASDSAWGTPSTGMTVEAIR
jgi:hypothetical protein